MCHEIDYSEWCVCRFTLDPQRKDTTDMIYYDYCLGAQVFNLTNTQEDEREVEAPLELARKNPGRSKPLVIWTKPSAWFSIYT